LPSSVQKPDRNQLNVQILDSRVDSANGYRGEARGQFVDEITTPHGTSSQTAGIGLLTIRDLLWLTVVVALSVGWFLDHRALAPKAADANDKEQMAKLVETMTQEIETYKELVASFEKERAEMRALTADRNL